MSVVEDIKHEKQLVKAKSKGVDVSADFVNILSSRIQELETGITSTFQAEREAAKAHRKQLREVQKYVQDKNNSVEDRIQYIQSKYAQQISKMIQLEKTTFEAEKELEVVTKERDKVQAELKKANTIKDKLEELCRQLQREVRELAEEGRKRNEEELKQRHDLQARFSSAIQDVNAKMDLHQKERQKQLEENDSLREKLTQFLEQLELREKHFQQQLHAKDLEVQLNQAKLEQQNAINTQLLSKAELLQSAHEEAVTVNAKLSAELTAALEIKAQNAMLQDSNKDLRAQLESYYKKFADFQSTLTKSNQLFDKLKGELDTHNKLRLVLQRDKEELKTKCENSDFVVARLTQERTEMQTELKTLRESMEAVGVDPEEVRKLRLQKQKLEDLCRVLQARLKGGDASTPTAPALSSDDRKSEDASYQEDEVAGSGVAPSATDAGGSDNGVVDASDGGEGGAFCQESQVAGSSGAGVANGDDASCQEVEGVRDSVIDAASGGDASCQESDVAGNGGAGVADGGDAAASADTGAGAGDDRGNDGSKQGINLPDSLF